MSRIILWIILILIAADANAEKWMWDTYKREDGSLIILSSYKGYDSLDDAIKSIDKNDWIGDIRVNFLSQFSELQSDINTYMLKHHPKKLAEALSSTGNMHNPKIIALREVFRQSILESRFVKKTNNSLSDRCEEISSVSFEKLYISNKHNNTKYEAMLWLSSQACT